MKRTANYFGLLLGLLAGLFLLFLLTMTLMDYRPEEKQTLSVLPQAQLFPSDTFRIVSWNIGYAGLSKEVDFFYDGGRQSRTSKAQTELNLNAITGFLQSQAKQTDIFFLQEVDTRAHRTYGIDVLSALSGALPAYTVFYGINYKVAFVPLPLHSPMGQVESGLAIFTKHLPARCEQYTYPSQEAWPTGVFSLDRCFLSARFPLRNGKQLVVINTHNSAFDQGSMRLLEMEYLRKYLLDEYRQGNYVVAGGDWNQNPPLPDSLLHYNPHSGSRHFRPLNISADYLPEGWQWVTDGYATNRFTDEPYQPGHTQETLLDFFIISPNMRKISVHRVDLGYEHSDHHPVVASFAIGNE